MLHVGAFYGAVTDGTTFNALPTVPDQAIPSSSNNKFLYPANQTAVCAWAMGDAITNARINAPSLRALALPYIAPLAVASVPASNAGLTFYDRNGPKILQNEETVVEASVGTQTVDTAYAALWTTPGLKEAPPGPYYTLRATATITTVVGQWVFGQVTFDQTLPNGVYSVVGMYATAATTALARLVFPSIANYRPGVLVMPNIGGIIPLDRFRYGRLGEWGRFYNTAQPGIEVLGTSAGATAYVIYLDVAKVG